MSVKLEKIIEEKQFVSDKISAQVRTVSLSIIAFVWIILIGKESLPFQFSRSFKGQFFIIGIVCLVIMFCDFLQYIFGYFYTNSLIRQIEAQRKVEGDYDYADIRYKLRAFFYWTKILILGGVIIWISALIIIYFISFI